MSGMQRRHKRLKKVVREQLPEPSPGSSLGTECENSFLHEVALNTDIKLPIREQIEQKFQQSQANTHYKFPRHAAAPSAHRVPRTGSVSPNLLQNQRHTRHVSATKLSRVRTASRKKHLRPPVCSKTPSYQRLVMASPYAGRSQRQQCKISIKRISPHRVSTARRTGHVHSLSAGALA